MKLPVVLTYHIIARCPPNADREERGLFVDPAAFQRQMDELARHGFESLTLDRYASMVAGGPAPPKSFLLTFDDAYAHVAPAVTPILRRHRFSAVMFANWVHLGGRNTWDAHHPNLAKLAIANGDQLVEMAAGPWEIASHGLCHVDLRATPRLHRHADLLEARERLSNLINKPVLDLAYPFGNFDAEVMDDVRRSGHRLAFGALPTMSVEPLQLPRRAISGTDSMAIFRLKAAGWSDRLYRVREITPGWALRTARTILGASIR